MCSLFVRTFNEGDEPSIVELFNSVYHSYGGFAPRTVEYWRWCCLERPDIEKKGIFLAFDGERLRGYLVAGSSGNVWEFCVSDDDREAAGVLLSEAMNYFEKISVSFVNVNVPSGTDAVDVLREAGFDEVPAMKMFVTTLNPAVLIQALITPRKNVVVNGFDDEFGVRLRDTPYGVSKDFSVKIENGSVEVAEGFSAKPSIVVELGFMDILSVLLGGSSMGRLFLSGRIRVRPFWKFGAVLRLMWTIQLRSSWFFPLSDFI